MSWFEYLLTEFAENGSIYDYIFKQHKQPHLPQVKVWATQIAEGTVMAGQSNQYIRCKTITIVASGYSLPDVGIHFVNLAHMGVSVAHYVCVCVSVCVCLLLF